MPAAATPDAAPVSTAQADAETDEIGPTEQASFQLSLVDTWVQTLQAAEAMHVCLHPSYVRHSKIELRAIVDHAIHARRGPSQMVAEVLAQGARGLVRKA